jgi:hypothetical protein
MLCIAVPVDEVVRSVTRDVVGLDKFRTNATMETNEFGITIPAAHSSIFHRRVYRRVKISLLFPLTLPAFLLCCLPNIIPSVVIARCKLVFVIVATIVESDFRLNALHYWRFRPKGANCVEKERRGRGAVRERQGCTTKFIGYWSRTFKP